MNIAETIYQHVKIMPTAKALEVLQFIAFIETKNNLIENEESNNDVLKFIQKLPVNNKRSDEEINQAFQTLRNEWE